LAGKFSRGRFWAKLSSHAREAGKSLVLDGLKLYFTAMGKRTPLWAQGVALCALAYFVSPLDAVPDATPGIGYADDAGVLATALSALRGYVTTTATRRAKATLKGWFGR
jgi:uncharacterized membrane protein YkvA (DUF1232 family)